MKEKRKQKKEKRKKTEPTGPNRPSRPDICAAPWGRYYPLLAPGQSTREPDRPDFPDFPFFFPIFRTYLHSNSNISRSTTPFSDLFVSTRS
jgi:hypothetical protein